MHQITTIPTDRNDTIITHERMLSNDKVRINYWWTIEEWNGFVKEGKTDDEYLIAVFKIKYKN